MPPKKGKGKKDIKPPPPPKLKIIGPPPKPKKPPPPPACFSPEDLFRFKQMFKEHDEENIEKIPLDLIPLMLRKLGFNPKGAEITELFKKILEDELVDTVEYHEWLFMIEAKMNWGDDFEHAVMVALQALSHDDDDSGVTDLQGLREELMTWGEPLSEIEFVQWIKLATKNKTYSPLDGQFNYKQFVEILNNKDTRFFPEPINYFKLDQKTLAELAIKKDAEEKAELAKKEAERLAREEARRQKMIEAGLINPDD